MTTDYRIAVGLTRAERARRQFPKPKPSNAAAKLGLRYERTVGKELERHANMGNFAKVEHNPWFTFWDEYGTANCCPDFLLYLEQGVVVTEVKLTWVKVALEKLVDLYCPVVSAALGVPTRPLVICRNLRPDAPPAMFSIRDAIISPTSPLLWPSTGHLLW